MLRLAKYLKPSLPMILIAIVLLFVQANSDLALPDYMSRIVNNGIQQGGVENAIPAAIRASQMDHLMIFLSESDQALVQSSYEWVDSTSADYDRYLQEYPVLASEQVYVLKNLDESATGALNAAMGRGLLVVSGIEAMLADPAKAAAMGLDLSAPPPGMDVWQELAKMPDAARAQIAAQIDSQFTTLGDSMVTQTAVKVVKSEYEALGMDTAGLQNTYILNTGGIMLLLSLLSMACTVAVSYLSAKTAAALGRDARRDVFRKVESFSNTEFDRFSTASLITRSTNDVTQVQMFVIMMIRMVFYAPIMGVGGIIRAMGKGSSMWWLIAVAVVMLISLVIIVFSIAQPKFKIIQSLIDRLNLVMRENLSGMMVIRAFNKQQVEEKRFDLANIDLTRTNLFVNRIMVVMFPMMMLIMNGLSIAILWMGAHQVAQANMQVGDMMAFMQYAMQIVFSFLMMSFMFIILPRASVSAGRISEVLATEPVIRDPQQPKTFSPTADRAALSGLVEFRNVSFRYPHAEEDVLHDISFTAHPGQMTAFIGSTGSGKSTVINLIPRFYDVSGGSILVDGMDIREVSQHDLREKIGYIPQKSNLFSGTIESNLRYASQDASEAELKEAIETAQASEFVDSKPEGLAAEIAQGGANVSGGQKQRLAIARALVKKAPIFIFDDSFSALDFKTDAALRRALKEKTADSTILVVTQRVSTVKNADQIIVLDEGKLMGKGTHQELMQSCETYREIALSQLSAEELS